MKKLIKKLPLVVLTGALMVSCGKNSSGSGSSSSSATTSVTATNSSGDVTNSINTNSYTSIVNTISGISMAENLPVGTSIYRVDSGYNGYSSSSSNENCKDVLWGAIQFCTYSSSGYNSYSEADFLKDVLRAGNITEIVSVSEDSVVTKDVTSFIKDSEERVTELIYSNSVTESKTQTINDIMMGSTSGFGGVFGSYNSGISMQEVSISITENNAQREIKGYLTRRGSSFTVSSFELPLYLNPLFEGQGYTTTSYLKSVTLPSSPTVMIHGFSTTGQAINLNN